MQKNNNNLATDDLSMGFWSPEPFVRLRGIARG